MKTLLTYGILLLFIISCKSVDDPHYEVDPLAKSLLDWHSGSYWIMKDSVTGQVDSLYVDYYEHTTRTGTYYTFEWIQYQIAVVNTSNPNDTANLIFEIGKNTPSIYFLKKSENDTLRPFQYDWPFQDSLSNISVSAGGRTYTNAYFAKIPCSKFRSTDTLQIAINHQDGLIKLSISSIFNNHNWTLLRSFINRP